MAMAWIFTAMIVISVVFGMVNGTMDAVSGSFRRQRRDHTDDQSAGCIVPVERRSGSHGPKRPVQ